MIVFSGWFYHLNLGLSFNLFGDLLKIILTCKMFIMMIIEGLIVG